MKTFLTSAVVQLALALVFLYGLFMGTDVTETLNALPITGINNDDKQQAATDDDLNKLYPLVAIHHADKSAPSQPSEIISVDDAFTPKITIVEPIRNKEPDYFPALQNPKVLDLQAITGSGAIISKHYYAYNAPLTEYAYTAHGKEVIPTLQQSAIQNSVQVAETPGKRRFTITLTQ